MKILANLRRIIFWAFPGGFRATPAEIRVRRPEGWIVIPRAKICAVKSQSVSHIVVRLVDGQRFVLNLFRFSSEESERVLQALNNASSENSDRWTSNQDRD